MNIFFTLFSVQGLRNVTRFVNGTTAGTPPADALFVVSIGVVLAIFEDAIMDADLFNPIVTGAANDFFAYGDMPPLNCTIDPVVYEDDPAFCLIGPAETLAESAARAMSALHVACASIVPRLLK